MPRARHPRLAVFRLAVLISSMLAACVAAPASARVAPARTIWTIAGTGTPCAAAPQCGDGGSGARAAMGFPQGVALDSGGDLYIVDMADNEIRKLSPAGVITIVAGDGTPCEAAPACGDGGPATSAQLNAPTGVAVDRRGDVFVADAGDEEIRKVAPDGTITRLAGTGAECANPGTCGDGAPAVSAALASPDGVALGPGADLYIADARDQEIRRVDGHGTITTVAGNGSQCAAAPACGDGGPATAAELNFPEGLAFDAHGAMVIADNGDNEIRRVSAGRITRVAGTGSACTSIRSCGDGGSALTASLNAPEGVAVDRSGAVYIADWGDNEVRVVSRRGSIARLAGDGSACALPPACGDTGAASAAQLSSPEGLAVDAGANVYVGDTFDDEVRLIPATSAAPARARSAHGSFALLAFATTTTRSALTVHFVLSAPARVSLAVVHARAQPLLAAHSSAAGGLAQLFWNRHLSSRTAPRGHYTLTVAARYGTTLLSSSLRVTL
jgi:trimeric autotransporter adhesin